MCGVLKIETADCRDRGPKSSNSCATLVPRLIFLATDVFHTLEKFAESEHGIVAAAGSGTIVL